MYLLKGHEGALSGSKLATPSMLTEILVPQSNTFWRGLFGEERPKDMLVLLGILVLLLHVWGGLELLQPVETETPAQPLVMEVSMIAMSAPKPAAAPPPPSPPPQKKPEPQKPKLKPIPRKAPPIVQQKAPDFAPTEQVVEQAPAIPQTAPAETSAVSDSKPAPTTNAEQFTEANFRANYAHNPKPEYPTIAKSRGWQGKVMLRVQVSAEGSSESVEVETSSGHEILDESAIEAVKKWKFIPAKRGEKPVASSVIVPIIFTLRD